MTWSIVAHDPESGAFAVAIATCAFAVGAHCPYVRSGVGAVATQSITNRYLGPAILDLIEGGVPPRGPSSAPLPQTRAGNPSGPRGGSARPHGRLDGQALRRVVRGSHGGTHLGRRQHAGR